MFRIPGLGRWKRALTRTLNPAGSDVLTRLEPLSRSFGLDRGTPIDRYYIEAFLAENASLIRGAVLEVGESVYTRRFGGGQVDEANVLAFQGSNQPGVVVGDLCRPETLPEARFDCFICTQTFNVIFDLPSAVKGAHRMLKPGGVLLLTAAGISQISRYDMDRWGDYWRMTDASMKRLLEASFSSVEARSFGNVLAATSLLHGLAVEDLPERARLDLHDADYPVTVTAVAHRAS